MSPPRNPTSATRDALIRLSDGFAAVSEALAVFAAVALQLARRMPMRATHSTYSDESDLN